MKRTALMAAFLLLFAAACDSGGKGGGADGKPTDKTADSKPLTDDQVDSADLPVEEDFEEEATKEINEDNLDDQVAALEKEIDADTE